MTTAIYYQSLMTKLPEQWQRLFEVLAVDRCGQEKLASVWYKRAGKETKKTWDSLLQAVVHLEPTIEGECLHFRPLLVCLKERVAKGFMTFLLDHHYSVSPDTLHHFLRTVLLHLPPSHWCVLECHKLLQCVAGRTAGLDKQAAWFLGEGKDASAAVWLKGSEENASSEELLHDEQSSEACAHSQEPQNMAVKMEFIESSGETVASQKTKTAVKNLRATAVFLTEDATTDRKALSTTKELEDVKFARRNCEVASQSSAGDGFISTKIHKEHTSDISYFESQLQRLREAWMAGEKQKPSDLEVLASVPPSQMEAVCQLLGLADMAETSLVVAADHMSSLAKKLSERSSICLICSMVESKFASLTMPSRLFTSCLTVLATAFPRQLLGILCLCLSTHSSSVGQAETVASLCKTAFDSKTLGCFLRELCQHKVPVNENTVSIAQSIIDQRPELESSLIAAALAWLEAVAMQQAESAKYGRLVLCLVKTYRAQLDICHLASVRVIVDTHKSVIRRSLQQLLKSLP